MQQPATKLNAADVSKVLAELEWAKAATESQIAREVGLSLEVVRLCIIHLIHIGRVVWVPPHLRSGVYFKLTDTEGKFGYNLRVSGERITGENRRDRQAKVWFILADRGKALSLARLHEVTGIGTNTLRETLKSLEAEGLVSAIHRPTGNRGRPRKYWVADSSESVVMLPKLPRKPEDP